MSKRTTASPRKFPAAYLIEVSWEICNQVGGIYTVMRSKVPAMVANWGTNYCMLGPYVGRAIQAELEPLDQTADVFGQAAAKLRNKGYDVHYAEWLVTGRPRVVLFNPHVIEDKTLNVVKYLLWKNHGIGMPADNALINDVVSLAFQVKMFLDELMALIEPERPVIAHFHEWMAGLPILDIRRENMRIKTIFTTHATQLGRHLAINSPMFYAHLPFFKWEEEARKFNIETEVRIEFTCANKADLPEYILPNGLNIERFEALFEFQNLHATYKDEIHQFVMGHFFQSYSFDLDKTMYFFTSGRYEFKNKGFDLTLEALYRLNQRLKAENADVTVVMFFVTRRDFTHIRPEVLQSRAVMEEIRQTCMAIERQVGKRLFLESTVREDHRLPNLSDFVDDYWKLRYRRIIQSWKSKKNPDVLTHQLVDEEHDEIYQFLKSRNMLNHADDKVKIVYHPDFINSSSPLFAMEYNQFVRGCNLGIFPSYYEPWGYTPLECMASGIPAITSDLSGFGDYLLHHLPQHEDYGLHVIERGKRTFDYSANQLMEVMYNFLPQSRRERIMQRNNVENNSGIFDWLNLISYYQEAYQALLRSDA
jgi:glycogen(starch) synthase